jgi:hypothetical protein
MGHVVGWYVGQVVSESMVYVAADPVLVFPGELHEPIGEQFVHLGRVAGSKISDV